MLTAFRGERLTIEARHRFFGLGALGGCGGCGWLGSLVWGKGEKVNGDQTDEADHDRAFESLFGWISSFLPCCPSHGRVLLTTHILYDAEGRALFNAEFILEFTPRGRGPSERPAGG